MNLSLITVARSRWLRAARPATTLFDLIARARQRRCLARLDDHLLRDIGLSRTEAQTEAARPFWDAPRHWYRNRDSEN